MSMFKDSAVNQQVPCSAVYVIFYSEVNKPFLLSVALWPLIGCAIASRFGVGIFSPEQAAVTAPRPTTLWVEVCMSRHFHCNTSVASGGFA
jgi:hypothetical protein